ncbi:MAG: tetratricopeptide repeat protein [Pseudodesulfovibrio sp.]
MIARYLFLLVLAALLAAAPAHAAADRLPPLARQALHKAQLRMDAGQFAEAAAILRGHLEQPGEEVPAQVYLMLGAAHHRNRDTRRALGAFEAGMQAHPDSDLLARNAAVACYELERYADAGRLFEKAYGLKSPRDGSLLFHAGSAYYGGEDYAAAARVLGRMLADEPNPQKDWVRLAVHAHLQAGLFRQTESILLRYLEINPEEAPYWELLAKLHLDREEYAKAAGALDICYRLRKPSAKELARLASLYAYADAPLMATAALRRAGPDAGDAATSLRIAGLYVSAGRTQEALLQLSRYGRSPDMAENRGRMLYQARRFKEAEAEFAEALARDGVAPECRFLLGMCAWERRDWETAKANFMKLRGDKAFSRRVQSPLAVIADIEAARREGGG